MRITREKIEEFAKYVNDTNPIHYGKDCIAPAIMILSMLLAKIVRKHPYIAITESFVKFSVPVRPGDRLRFKYAVKNKHIQAVVTNQDNTPVISIKSKYVKWRMK